MPEIRRGLRFAPHIPAWWTQGDPESVALLAVPCHDAALIGRWHEYALPVGAAQPSDPGERV